MLTGGAKKFLYKKKSGGDGFIEKGENEYYTGHTNLHKTHAKDKSSLLDLDEVWNIRSNVSTGGLAKQAQRDPHDLDRTVDPSLYSRYNTGGSTNSKLQSNPQHYSVNTMKRPTASSSEPGLIRPSHARGSTDIRPDRGSSGDSPKGRTSNNKNQRQHSNGRFRGHSNIEDMDLDF